MMFDCFQNRLTLTGILTAETAFRIGAGRGTEVVGTDLPVVRDARGRPYIPGSSFKGALRAYIEALVRAICPNNKKAACNPVGKKDEWCLEQITEKMTDARVEEETCLVCRVFGSPWLASRVSIRDLLSVSQDSYGLFEVRNGVAIDRDTETAGANLLYDFEVVPAGSQFDCKIVIENADDWQLGLLMAGLRPFEQGEAVLGGARSRGLGLVRIDWKERSQVTSDNLLDFLTGHNVALTWDAEAFQRQRAQWLAALKTKLMQYGGQGGA